MQETFYDVYSNAPCVYTSLKEDVNNLLLLEIVLLYTMLCFHSKIQPHVPSSPRITPFDFLRGHTNKRSRFIRLYQDCKLDKEWGTAFLPSWDSSSLLQSSLAFPSILSPSPAVFCLLQHFPGFSRDC